MDEILRAGLAALGLRWDDGAIDKLRNTTGCWTRKTR